jgi:hypothetical protein
MPRTLQQVIAGLDLAQQCRIFAYTARLLAEERMRTLADIYSPGPCPLCGGHTNFYDATTIGVTVYTCLKPQEACSWWFIDGLGDRETPLYMGVRPAWLGGEARCPTT